MPADAKDLPPRANAPARSPQTAGSLCAPPWRHPHVARAAAPSRRLAAHGELKPGRPRGVACGVDREDRDPVAAGTHPTPDRDGVGARLAVDDALGDRVGLRAGPHVANLELGGLR